MLTGSFTSRMLKHDAWTFKPWPDNQLQGHFQIVDSVLHVCIIIFITTMFHTWISTKKYDYPGYELNVFPILTMHKNKKIFKSGDEANRLCIYHSNLWVKLCLDIVMETPPWAWLTLSRAACCNCLWSWTLIMKKFLLMHCTAQLNVAGMKKSFWWCKQLMTESCWE